MLVSCIMVPSITITDPMLDIFCNLYCGVGCILTCFLNLLFFYIRYSILEHGNFVFNFAFSSRIIQTKNVCVYSIFIVFRFN